MFNPLTPPGLLIALSALLREGAARDEPLDPYMRAQLMAGMSIAKYLAAELEDGAGVTHWLQDAVGDALAEARDGADPDSPLAAALDRTAAALGEAGTVPALGAPLGDLLAAARADGSPAAAALTRRLHAILRELTDREVEMLARSA